MGSAIKINQKDFSKQIYDAVNTKHISYIDAILELCNIHGIEPDSVSKLISKPIKEKLEIEGREMNLIRKKASLF